MKFIPANPLAIPGLNIAFNYETREHVVLLIERVTSHVRRSVKAYEKNDDAAEKEHASKVETMLAPLGIETCWPGLFPAFKVNGSDFHGIREAVLYSISRPLNWILPDEVSGY